jgi:hypothetical protein
LYVALNENIGGRRGPHSMCQRVAHLEASTSRGLERLPQQRGDAVIFGGVDQL